LALSSGALVLHLGIIDESLVRTQDFYICIHTTASNVAPALYACWRTTNESTGGEIVYRKLDPNKDPITALHIEMLAGEELPHLLQTLLVGVEHAICRVPLEELTFPSSSSSSSSLCPPAPITKAHSIDINANASNDNNSTATTNCLIDDKNAGKRMECNLKRRELITKNNSINKKYAVKRNGTNTTTLVYGDNESETLDGEIVVCTGNNNSNSNRDSIDSTNDVLNGSSNALTSGAIISTLPLFCLGGSFPHIDSDEESGDDAKRISSGELQSCICHVTYSLP
jgi:hypothetical protein